SSNGGAGGSVTLNGGTRVEVAKDIVTGGGNLNIASPGLINIGYNLTEVSPLSLTKNGGINTSSSTGVAGTVTLNAATSVRVAKGINAQSNTTSGGGLSLVNVTGNTVRIEGTTDASNKMSGGGNNVNITALGGNDIFGLDVGPITSAGGGGNVVLTANAGSIIARGKIN